MPTKTKASVREIPLADQLVRMLATDRATRARAADADWVFPSSNGSARSQRNVVRRGLRAAARKAGIDNDGRPPLRFHDLRHTFASHPIIDGETSFPDLAGGSSSPAASRGALIAVSCSLRCGHGVLMVIALIALWNG